MVSGCGVSVAVVASWAGVSCGGWVCPEGTGWSFSGVCASCSLGLVITVLTRMHEGELRMQGVVVVRRNHYHTLTSRGVPGGALAVTLLAGRAAAL